MNPGKPTVWTQEVADLICQGLAAGKSLRAVCREEGMPDESTVREWVIDNYHDFGGAYTRARDLGLDCMADAILDIADDSSRDTITDEGGNETCDREWVTRSRLRVETRKWYLCKLAPKKYGDKLEQTLKGDATAPVVLALNGSDVHG